MPCYCMWQNNHSAPAWADTCVRTTEVSKSPAPTSSWLGFIPKRRFFLQAEAPLHRGHWPAVTVSPACLAPMLDPLRSYNGWLFHPRSHMCRPSARLRVPPMTTLDPSHSFSGWLFHPLAAHVSLFRSHPTLGPTHDATDSSLPREELLPQVDKPQVIIHLCMDLSFP